jgi:hypothetical protein
MEIVPLTRDRYKEWDAFCLESDDAWFWHTTEWLEYTLNYKPELRSQSFSFMLINNGRIEVICPLLLELHERYNKEVREFSFGGSPGLIPALKKGMSEKIRTNRFKEIFNHIDGLAEKNEVLRTSFRFSPLAPVFQSSETPSYNYLMRFGYIPISLNTQIIDLSKSLEELWGDIRHGHEYHINQGFKEMEVEIFDKETINRKVFDEYQHLHHKAAGRITRPQITFDLMFNWILNGQAILVGAKLAGGFIGFSYIFIYKGGAYYGSASSDPDYEKRPMGHILTWMTIKWLKEHGCRYYEIGYQQYHPLPYDLASGKEINISAFKRGFGGFTVPLFIGEKYYSKDYYLKINLDRVKGYANYLEKDKNMCFVE